MPWVKRQGRPAKGIWIIGVVLGVLFGVLLGYERWGSTAAVVGIVEKELNGTESRIADLERRLLEVEAKLVLQESQSNGTAGEAKANAKMAGQVTRTSSQNESDPTTWRSDSY